MANIEFKAGYYEWLLYINGKFAYTFSSFDTEQFDTKKELRAVVDMTIDSIVEDVKDYGSIEMATMFNEDNEEEKEMFEQWRGLTQKDIKNIKEVICKCWERYCITDYEAKKNQVRNEAIEWSNHPDETASWKTIIEKCDYFHKLGKRYGLLKEFRENGVC